MSLDAILLLFNEDGFESEIAEKSWNCSNMEQRRGAVMSG